MEVHKDIAIMMQPQTRNGLLDWNGIYASFEIAAGTTSAVSITVSAVI
jgi:hypothetical protein